MCNIHVRHSFTHHFAFLQATLPRPSGGADDALRPAGLAHAAGHVRISGADAGGPGVRIPSYLLNDTFDV